jgi:hypothetical protein
MPTVEEILKAREEVVAGASLEDVLAADTDPNDPGLLRRSVEEGKRGLSAAGRNLAAGAVGSAASLDETTANLFMILDKGAQYLSQATGLSRGGAFQRVEKFFRDEAGQLTEAARKRAGTDLPSRIFQTLGGLPLGVAQAGAAATVGGPVAGFAGLGALSEAHRGPHEAALAAIEGGLIGSIFKGTTKVAPLPRSMVVGSATGALESVRGVEPQEAMLAAATTGTLAGLTARTAARPPLIKAPEVESRTEVQLRPKGRGAVAEPEAKPAEVVEVAERPAVEITPRTVAKTTEFLGRDYSDIEIPNKAVNLNLRKIEGTEDFKKATTTLVELYRNEIDQSRRGSISRVQTARMAEDLGLTYEQLLSRRRGQALNAEEATAFRMMNRSVLEEWHRLANLVRSGKANDRDKAEFLRATALSEASIKQTLGATAEAGRALSAFNLKLGPSTAQMKHIRALIQDFRAAGKLKNQGGLDEFADMVAALDKPEALAKFAEVQSRATIGDKFLEVWINGLLSGPQTHAVNTLSNSLVSLFTIPTTFTAAGFGAARSGIGKLVGREAAERVFLREGVSRLHGVIEGAREGLQLAGKTLSVGAPPEQFPLAKTEIRFRSIKGPFGELVRTPGRVLIAEDAFFQAVGFRQELKAQAMRKAISEGHRGRALAKRTREIERAPDEEMLDASYHNARVQTFTNALGPAMKGFSNFTNIHPTVKLFFPFIRTPTNIFKYSVKHTPLGLAMREVREEIKKGGAARDTALARIAFGSAVMAWTAAEAAKGNITGSGPAAPELRNPWMVNNQPFSIKVPDEAIEEMKRLGVPMDVTPGGTWWLSYSRLEPLGILLGVAADYANISGHIDEATAEEISAELALSVTRNIANKVFLRGMNSIAEALADPRRFFPRLGKNLAGSVVPAIASQYTRTIRDPLLRDARSATDAIRARVPGYSTTLPPTRNIWGEAIELGGGLGPDFVSPVYSKAVTPDFTSEEAVRLKARISKPDRKAGKLELTPEEYSDLAMRGGSRAKRLIDGFTGSVLYNKIPDPIKREIIESYYRQAQAVARAEVLKEIASKDPTRLTEAQLRDSLVGELQQQGFVK